jgi:hypothetical protein
LRHGEHLGVRSRVLQQLDLIVRARDDSGHLARRSRRLALRRP